MFVLCTGKPLVVNDQGFSLHEACVRCTARIPTCRSGCTFACVLPIAFVRFARISITCLRVLQLQPLLIRRVQLCLQLLPLRMKLLQAHQIRGGAFLQHVGVNLPEQGLKLLDRLLE